MELNINGVVNQMSTATNRLFGGGQGFRVQWFDAWEPYLDEALSALPESDACPRELYRLLSKNKIAERKIIALVTDGTAPAAIITLRRHGRRWLPITQWMLPGFLFPSKPGVEARAVAALGIELDLDWWRMDTPPPEHPYRRYLVHAPTYCMPSTDDPERFWRDSGRSKGVRQARNHCRDLTIAVDPPGGLEWVITRWAEKWTSPRDNFMNYIEDRILAASYFASINKYHTVVINDHGEPVGGLTMLVHKNDLVWATNYRKPEYDHLGVGTRLMDFCFYWGIENGFASSDIGGGHEYKKIWAPPNGARWIFQMSPPSIYVPKELLRKGRRFGTDIIHSGQQTEPKPTVWQAAGND